jgi:hypothetical protein
MNHCAQSKSTYLTIDDDRFIGESQFEADLSYKWFLLTPNEKYTLEEELFEKKTSAWNINDINVNIKGIPRGNNIERKITRCNINDKNVNINEIPRGNHFENIKLENCLKKKKKRKKSKKHYNKNYNKSDRNKNK